MSGAYRLALAAEDRRGADSARLLADRVITEPFVEGLLIADELRRGKEHLETWLSPVWPSIRQWQGLDEGSAFLAITHAVAQAQAAGLPLRGSFGGEPGVVDALTARAALLLFQKLSPLPDLVILARDLGGDARRRQGFSQALQDRRWPFPVVFALAEPEVEAWYLAGFEPSTKVEAEHCDRLRSDLGFHPHQFPERLKEGRTHHDRDAKGVFERLAAACGIDALALEVRCLGGGLDDRENRGGGEPGGPLSRLVERGRGCGLTTYLAAVLSELVGLISTRTTPTP